LGGLLSSPRLHIALSCLCDGVMCMCVCVCVCVCVVYVCVCVCVSYPILWLEKSLFLPPGVPGCLHILGTVGVWERTHHRTQRDTHTCKHAETCRNTHTHTRTHKTHTCTIL